MRYRFMRFPDGKPKAVTLSYDDGCRADIRFSQTITEHGLRATFNICSGHIGGPNNLSAEEIREHIINKGHEIAVHGEYHRASGCQKTIDGIKDVLNCRLGLEKTFGGIIRGMAYPDSGITGMHNGTTYESIKHYLTDLGIVYSRTLGGDNTSFMLPADWHAWMPSVKHTNSNVMDYIDQFVSINLDGAYCASRYPRLFYMWGHSFEFDNDNNWELLDNICQKLSGHDDVWYAANIQIYDYVKAYDSLVFSADESTVYNPTLLKVWFDVDGKLYCVGSGETLHI